MENRSIPGLDLIRFAAAAMVAWFHLAFNEWQGTAVQPLGRLSPVASFGWVGVEVFFVLSGFVIAYSAEGKSAMAFARSRFLRLYPAVWICATLSLLFVTQKDIGSAFLRSMMLWPFAPWVDGVYWTLGVEMVFYGLIFLLLAVDGFPRLSNLLAVIGAVSSAFWGAWLADHLTGGNHFAWTMGHRYFELLLVHFGCYFALGGTIWLLMLKEPRKLDAITAVTSYIAGLICIYAIASMKAKAGTGHSPVIPMAAWSICIVAIALAVAWRAGEGWPSFKVARTIGKATYPLYLLHHVIGAWLIVRLLEQGYSALSSVLMALALAVAASFAVLYPEKLLAKCAGTFWDRLVGFWRVTALSSR